MTTGVGRFKFNGRIDIKSIVEQLAGQGEEIKVSKALVHLHFTDTCYYEAEMAAMISDQAIATADPGENSSIGNLDDDCDVLTAGDYELQQVGQTRATMLDPTAPTYKSHVFLDITPQVQKYCALLARSAVLATDPYFSLVIAGMTLTSNTAPTVNGTVLIAYSVHQKPLRMLA